MADVLDETEKLFARANAAIAEAARLAEESLGWRKSLGNGIRLMRFRATFYPKSLKIYSPVDFLHRLRPYEPFPNEIDRRWGTKKGSSISDPRADNSD